MENTPTLYKVLVEGKSCHGGDLTWSPPTQQEDGTYRPGNWHSVRGPISMCDNGIHLTTEPLKWLKVGCQVYRAQGMTSGGTLEDKHVFRRARLLAPAPDQIPTWWHEIERFCLDEIPAVPWLKPQGEPDPSWHLSTAPTLAAAWDAAWAAAWAAAWGAAGAAAWDAAWAAARAAAWDAAWGAARAAAGAATRAAAGAASLYAQCCILCADLPLAEEHKAHARARWDVWQRGYGVGADVNGVLYVYGVQP